MAANVAHSVHASDRPAADAGVATGIVVVVEDFDCYIASHCTARTDYHRLLLGLDCSGKWA